MLRAEPEKEKLLTLLNAFDEALRFLKASFTSEADVEEEGRLRCLWLFSTFAMSSAKLCPLAAYLNRTNQTNRTMNSGNGSGNVYDDMNVDYTDYAVAIDGGFIEVKDDDPELYDYTITQVCFNCITI